MDVPLLCSPVPFQNAALSTPEVKCMEWKRADHPKESSDGGEHVLGSSAGLCYSIEIKDAYLPPWIIRSMCAVMGSEEGPKLEEGSSPHDETKVYCPERTMTKTMSPKSK
ncbi:uncharacterized protein LOC122293823 [Carya illinoinensis]|uniref:uncharacterized protein LOC122293823 n=1 Tax=Carya illinoinensis TaxID=32201 RepID=UPI001C720ED2|nr:uncharacterized protein LOC122293823 [Carya illinoinensis]